MTWVINPAVGCHYFSPGLQLPPQPWRGLLPSLLLGKQRHNGFEQFSEDCHPTALRLRFEPGPLCASVQHANHSATEPPITSLNKGICAIGQSEQRQKVAKCSLISVAHSTLPSDADWYREIIVGVCNASNCIWFRYSICLLLIERKCVFFSFLISKLLIGEIVFTARCYAFAVGY